MEYPNAVTGFDPGFKPYSPLSLIITVCGLWFEPVSRIATLVLSSLSICLANMPRVLLYPNAVTGFDPGIKLYSPLSLIITACGLWFVPLP